MDNPKEEDKLKRKMLGLISLVVVAVLTLVGCGDGWAKRPNYYRPSAFGENSQCYFVNDPAEAVLLQQQGFCDPTWRPVMAPVYWQARYAPYYESAEYRDYYVPANRRAQYTTYFVTFDRQHASEIRTEQSKAQYKDNKGTVVDGNKVPRGQFGGGVRSKGGSGIRGDKGKSMVKQHDSRVKQIQKDEKKQQDKINKQNKQNSKTGGSNSGGNKKSSTGGGGIRGGSNKSSGGSNRIGSSGRR